MKIVHVVPVMGCGGAEILLGLLALQQKKLGHEVAIVTLRPLHETFDHYPNRELLKRSVQIKITPSRASVINQRRTRSNLDDWRLFLEQFNPDVIHAHLYEADFLAHSVIREHTCYVTHIHGKVPQLLKKRSLNLNKKHLQVWLERQWLHHRYRRSRTHFIVPSSSVYEYARHIVPPSLHANIHLLHNAINLTSFPFVKRNKISLPIRMITVGNLLSIKNHDFLITVLKILRDEGIDCHLDILGYGVEESRLRHLIESLRLKGSVHLRGSVGNVNEYLSKADIYLHASIPEAFGLAIAEAIAAGLPVIALDGGGTSDLVKDGINGFLLKEKKADVFAEKIKLLLENQLLYQSMSQKAVNIASKFDIQDYTLNMLEIYEKAMDEK